ncbi:MAG: ABC transporter substrate-binding protein [Solobacterium sp.]|nr:ABC transporter substrate-binding protein [Solobacterium sp.]
MKYRSFLTAVIAGVTAASLVGCGSSSSEAPAPSSTDTAAPAETSVSAEPVSNDSINIELTTAPVGLHPLKTNDSPSTYVNGQIFETLYRRTYDGTAYDPLLAEELPEFSEDGTVATIKLRKGVTFHDGTPFTAEAVGYMIDSLKDENYGSQRPSIVESIDTYEIIDDNTIQLNLLYSDGVLVAKLAHTNGCIVNPALDQSQDLLVDATGAGTGPYQYVSSTAGSTYSLTAYDNYWGGAPDIKNVKFDVIADEATAVARLQTGEADLYPTIQADSYDTAAAIDGYTAVSETSSAVYFLNLRSRASQAVNPNMENKDFRKALIEAIDMPTYVDAVIGNQGSYPKSIVGPTLVGYTPEMDNANIAYDPDDAKAIIDANGWAGQEVIFLVSTREWHQTVAAYVQDQLSKVGINVTVVSEEWATYLADAKLDDYFDFCILSWSNVTGDGQQMLEPNFSIKNGVRTKYDNEEFDAAVDASAKSTVLAERQAALLEAVNLIQGDAIVAPLYSPNTAYVYNSAKFSNVIFDKGGQFNVKDFKAN